MARYLITGVAGFIGSSLAHHVLQQGHEVIGIDNLVGGDVHNLDDIIRDIDFRVIDINETLRLRECCRGVDYVLHQAALASVPRSIREPQVTHVANVDGTLSVLIAARDAGVKRVVYAASSSAYGDKSSQPKNEDMIPSPLSPYAAQKLAGEYYVKSFWHVYGLEGVCLRYFNVFGPRQGSDSPYSGVIAKFASEILKGNTPLIFGDGNQSRDFTYIDNVVSANLLACMAPATDVAGRVFNVGTGQSHSLNQTYELMSHYLSFKKKPLYTAPRLGDVLHSEADLSLSRKTLGYEPLHSFKDGLAKTVGWFLEQEASAITKSSQYRLVG
jgi:UDP-glucose 4-epimerase